MEWKQVIVVRTEYQTEKGILKPRRGKIIAQAGHASSKWLAERFTGNVRWGTWDRWGELTPEQEQWLCGLSTKVCVHVKTEKELREIHEKAIANGLESHIIVDSGKTEFDGPEPTCCAIGPGPAHIIDEITGDLPLY